MSILAVVTALALSIIPADERPTVPTQQGAVQGVQAEGVAAFKGLPYAAPPVGPLRWRPPQPVQPWTETRAADHVGAICIQPPANGDNAVGPGPMSEDCLTLNVWAPSGATEALPVMFWVHGGGYVNGSGTADLYDGSNLARHGVVVVTINYRLGRLGFFDHPALAAERPADEPAGNYGVMDMIAALKWVHANIGRFGGDAGDVTIFGESAGGVAITQLMLAPDARGLFAKAIVQSGVPQGQTSRLDVATPSGPPLAERGAAFAALKGVPADGSTEALRAIPGEAFLEPAPNFGGGDLVIADGRIVPTSIEDGFAQGLQAPVPLIVGTNSNEFPWARADTNPIAQGLTPDERSALIAAYVDEDDFQGRFISDAMFNGPARWLARTHAAAGHPTWLYSFDAYPDAMPQPHRGAWHAQERQYAFDTLNASPWPTTERDEAVAKVMSDYWATFAKTGVPAAKGQPAWPVLGEGAGQALVFHNEGVAVEPAPNAARLDLIDALLRRLKAAGLR